jgi:hypothetical protein
MRSLMIQYDAFIYERINWKKPSDVSEGREKKMTLDYI